MKVRILAISALMSLVQISAPAQGLRTSPRPAVSLPVAAVPTTREQQQADFIVAIVNSEPITNHQVNVEVQRILQQLAQQRRAQPDQQELSKQVLERLINERAQLQLARETGIKVDEPSIDQAEQTVARQNQMDVTELRRRIVLEGLDPKLLREQLRDQIILTRLREREVEPRVRISDLEVEQYLNEQRSNGNDLAKLQINIAQLLVSIPEGASEVQIAELKKRAEQTLSRAKQGEDFGALVLEMSDAKEKSNGGQLGLKPADRYPALFLEATASLGIGEISSVVRSGAGFHILRLLERQTPGLPPKTVTQSHARHILLIPSPQLSEAAARDKLNDFRKRIVAGQVSFEALAKENSQDGSAVQGGDLGWANPGQFVPEFEEVMNRLSVKQISEPLISRFGVHLIQLLERRTSVVSEREQNEMIRNMMRDKKFNEVFINWAQDVRARAYVELRDPPL
jgi:peptidyl-prolyl cis-trans isomerase SurA